MSLYAEGHKLGDFGLEFGGIWVSGVDSVHVVFLIYFNYIFATLRACQIVQITVRYLLI